MSEATGFSQALTKASQIRCSTEGRGLKTTYRSSVVDSTGWRGTQLLEKTKRRGSERNDTTATKAGQHQHIGLDGRSDHG